MEFVEYRREDCHFIIVFRCLGLVKVCRPADPKDCTLPLDQDLIMVWLNSIRSVPYNCLYFILKLVFDLKKTDLFAKHVLLPFGSFGFLILS